MNKIIILVLLFILALLVLLMLKNNEQTPIENNDIEVEEEVDEPVVKRAKKVEVPAAASKAKLADVVSAWSDN
jgi:Na+-transporting methylmalonyl-CoA/oxaloacetate decarboxylase gamma subunit